MPFFGRLFKKISKNPIRPRNFWRSMKIPGYSNGFSGLLDSRDIMGYPKWNIPNGISQWPCQRRSRHSKDTVSEFHTEAPQVTASEGLALGPYVAGFKPATLRTKGTECTNEPPYPTCMRVEMVNYHDPLCITLQRYPK